MKPLPRVHLELATDIAAAREPWLALQDDCLGTVYQTYEWCSTWQRTVGSRIGVEPRILIGRNDEAHPVIILPLALHRRFRLNIVAWHAEPQIAYGFGLYKKDCLDQLGGTIGHLWPAILDSVGHADMWWLSKLPAQLAGARHPLAMQFTHLGANDGYSMRLCRDYETLYRERRSGATRRGSRKRDQRLHQLGDVSFGLPGRRDEAHARIDQMFDQQERRLRTLGVREPHDAQARDFVHALADLPQQPQPKLLPYHLALDGEMKSMMLGMLYDQTYWALISSHETGEIARHSPGDAALRRMIEACCDAGLARIDFGAGASDYKTAWADEVIPLHEILQAATRKGQLALPILRQTLAAKRKLKRSPRLWRMAQRMRAAVNSREA